MENEKFDPLSEAAFNMDSSKSVALIYLRNKRADLMNLALAFQPSSAEDAEEHDQMLNVFIELTNIYTAFGSAIDMVESIQKDIYKAQAINSKVKMDLQELMKESKKDKEIIAKLQERIQL